MSAALAPVQAVVIPTATRMLAVPSVLVAEVVRPTTHLQPGGGALVGILGWRGVRVPVVALELLAGGARPTPTPRARIVVFYPPAGSEGAYLGLWATGDPRSRTLTEELVGAGGPPPADGRFLTGSFTLDGETLGIPDLPAIRRAAGI